jgi:hypothetical protein
MSALIVVGWATVAGYVTAGILASLYQLLTNEPMSFRLLVTGGLAASLVSLPLLLFGGPAVIARNSWRGRIIEGRPLHFVVVAALIVMVWSFITGVFVLQFLLALGSLVA